MIIKLFYSVFFFLSINLYANENLTKLNNLFLNGVIDEKSYFKSLENIGIDTSNEIFINLFGLFSKQVLDTQSYENSLNNIISIDKSDNFESQIITNNKNEYEKIYKIKNCKGNSELCIEFSQMEFPIVRKNNKIFIKKLALDELVASRNFLIRVINTKDFNKNDRFDYIATLQHSRGMLIDLRIGAKLDDNDFQADNFSLRMNGTELLSAELELL